MAKNITFKAIDDNRDELIRAARKIWENPELGNQEFIAADTCEELLKKAFKIYALTIARLMELDL